MLHLVNRQIQYIAANLQPDITFTPASRRIDSLYFFSGEIFYDLIGVAFHIAYSFQLGCKALGPADIIRLKAGSIRSDKRKPLTLPAKWIRQMTSRNQLF